MAPRQIGRDVLVGMRVTDAPRPVVGVLDGEALRAPNPIPTASKAAVARITRSRVPLTAYRTAHAQIHEKLCETAPRQASFA